MLWTSKRNKWVILILFNISQAFSEENLLSSTSAITADSDKPKTLYELPKLFTKQDVNNIVFLDKEAKYSYFQNRSGGLYLSTNYRIIPIMQGNSETYYWMNSSKDRKKIVLERVSSFFSQNGLHSTHDLFVAQFGDMNFKKIGQGVHPFLHLNDTWVSSYTPFDRVLHLKNLKQSKFDLTILQNKHLNTYFIPQIIFLNSENVVFTDMNALGYEALFHLHLNTRKITLLEKVSTPNVRIELCLLNNQLVVGSFGALHSPFGSEIVLYKNLEDLLKKNKNSLYRSMMNDIGHLICENETKKIIFIQNQSPTEARNKYYPLKSEVVSLSLKDKKIQTLTNLQWVSQIIHMDGRVLLPHRENYFLLKGENTKNNESPHLELPKPEIDSEQEDIL
jgi:hypothetical protein